jgi:hypothetical protein
MVNIERDGAILELAQREAIAWFDDMTPAPAAVEKLLHSWETRFKLIEVG